MHQLGYSPNSMARALRNGRFGAIGLMAHDFSSTGEVLITEAVVQAAEAEGYAVTLVNVANSADGWEGAARRLSNQSIDGLVVIRADLAASEVLALPPGLPVAVSDSRLVGYYPGVGGSQVQGAIDATNHLLGLGHRTVHHLAGPSDSAPASARLAAWQRTLEDAGLVAPEVFRGDWSAKSGREAGELIAADESVTAVFCANDEMAVGAMQALHDAGLRVPDDISIVGFDDIALAEYLWPPLTTVRQDFLQIGRELVRLLLHQISSGVSAQYERTLVPTSLVVRGTTSAPGSARGSV